MVNFKVFGYKNVSLEITNKCNFKCVYCPYSLNEIQERQMTKEEAYKAIDELSVCGGDELEYLELNVLGEPLTHPNLLEIIDYAHRQNIRIRLITNGSLFSLKNIDNILNSQPAVLKVSLELLNGEYFNFMRGTKMSFNDYLDNVINLIKRRLEYGSHIPTLIQIDIFYISRYHLKKMLGMIPHDKFIKYIYHNKRVLLEAALSFLNKIHKNCAKFNYEKKKLFYNFGEIKNSHFLNVNAIPLYKISNNIILTLKEYFPWINIKNKYPEYAEYAKDARCMVDKMGILVDGRAVLCCLDYIGETAIGNIFNNRLENILRDAKYRIAGLRKGEFVFERCKRCQGYFTKRHRFFKRIKNRVIFFS